VSTVFARVPKPLCSVKRWECWAGAWQGG
jgi:hypothetical protein